MNHLLFLSQATRESRLREDNKKGKKMRSFFVPAFIVAFLVLIFAESVLAVNLDSIVAF